MGIYEVRWHGRGGQGAVTGAQLLAEAAFAEGKMSQAFPFYGAERRGAPVVAYTRISSDPIFVHSQILHPDAVVILDSSLISLGNLEEGLKKDGKVIINASPKEKQKTRAKAYLVDATKISLDHKILVAGSPVVNTSILGAITKATEIVSIDAILKAIADRFSSNPKQAKANVQAAKQAYEETIVLE
jgi:2-oxoacid:acceptor oxidoreductase gamma subunit (pyruvate/2-ketoisovalerate family)